MGDDTPSQPVTNVKTNLVESGFNDSQTGSKAKNIKIPYSVRNVHIILICLGSS